MTPQDNASKNSQKSPQAPSRREQPRPDDTLETASVNDETLIKQPSTFNVRVPPDLKPETRYGDVFLSERTTLTIQIKGLRETTVTVNVKDRLIIGRTVPKTRPETSPGLDLNIYGGYLSGVSREHALIAKEANILSVTDLGSRNGTYLNGVKLNPHQPRILRDGDELCLGTLVLCIYYSGTDPSARDS